MRLTIVTAFLSLTVATTAFAGNGRQKPEARLARPDAARVKVILEAPGTVYCYTNPGELDDDCAAREKGLRTFKQVYQSNPDVGLALIRKRLSMDPDPHGVFFAILAASKIGDPALSADLQRFIEREPGSRMGAFASQAISIIESGACTKDVPATLVEICPSPR